MGAATSGVHAIEPEEPGTVDPRRSEAGFAAMYRQHAGFTWACLRRLGVPPSAMDDAMQELWVTAHRRLDSLRGVGATKAWLYGIARRIASHQRRTEVRHRRKIDALGQTAPTHVEADRESTLVVESILASLDARVREAFVLSELEGWTAPEIAAATGANTNTIYWRVRTARHQLQSKLGDRDLDAEVIQLRNSTTPPRKSTAHCWLLIAPQLGKPSVVGGMFASWSAMKLAVVGAAVTVAVAAGVEVGMRPQRSSASSADAAPAAGARVTERASRSRIAAAAVLPAELDAAPPPTEIPASLPSVGAPRPTRARGDAPATTDAAPKSSAPTIDVTGEDARLLADAKAALTGGRTADARALLATHRIAFPTSKLADLRDALGLDLACRSGDAPEARRVVADAQTLGPLGPLLARAQAKCSVLGATEP